MKVSFALIAIAIAGRIDRFTAVATPAEGGQNGHAKAKFSKPSSVPQGHAKARYSSGTAVKAEIFRQKEAETSAESTPSIGIARVRYAKN